MQRVQRLFHSVSKIVPHEFRLYSKGGLQKYDGSISRVEQQVIRHILNGDTAVVSDILMQRLEARHFISGAVFRDALKLLASFGEIERIDRLRNSLLSLGNQCPVHIRQPTATWNRLLLDAYYNKGQLGLYGDQILAKMQQAAEQSENDYELDVFNFMLLAMRYSPKTLDQFLSSANAIVGDDKSNPCVHQTRVVFTNYLNIGSILWRVNVCNERFTEANAMLAEAVEVALNTAAGKKPAKKQQETWIAYQIRRVCLAIRLLATDVEDSSSERPGLSESESALDNPDPELLWDKQKALKFLDQVRKKREEKSIPELSTIEQLIQNVNAQSKLKILDYFDELFEVQQVDLLSRQRALVQQISCALMEEYLSERQWDKLLACCERTNVRLRAIYMLPASNAQTMAIRAASETIVQSFTNTLRKVKTEVLFELDRILSLPATDASVENERSAVGQLMAINTCIRDLMTYIEDADKVS